MPPEAADAASLHDMVKAGESVARYIVGKTFADYQSDEMLQSAVERKIEIAGEAARRISKTFQLANPQVPWSKIIGTRHVLAHDYDEINHAVVWRIATVYIPQVLALVKPLVPMVPPESETESKPEES